MSIFELSNAPMLRLIAMSRCALQTNEFCPCRLAAIVQIVSIDEPRQILLWLFDDGG
jgi:hypothetical protein